MLIHQVRLGGTGTCDPLERFLHVYQSDLNVLFNKHEETIKSKRKRSSVCERWGVLEWILVDEES